jgi:large subunit ribosomal protein L6
MSRLGKKPIVVPAGVKVDLKPGNVVEVAGPKGRLLQTIHPDIKVEVTAETVLFKRPTDSKIHKSLHGLSRSLVQNMVAGVTTGWQKKLELEGVGYRAQLEGNKLSLQVGFTHPVVFNLPSGITAEVVKQTKITLTGSDKQVVGQLAAEIRRVQPPEPYQGKGIRYAGEHIRRKVGKAVAAAGGAGDK